jgi:hypothetical protein
MMRRPMFIVPPTDLVAGEKDHSTAGIKAGRN